MWIANLLGLALIAGIVWWFWLYKPRDIALDDKGVINITVENGIYLPSRIRIPANKTTTLRFTRKDASPCAEMVIFNELNTSAELPVNQAKDIELSPKEPGHFTFNCQMQMYKGELDVVTEQ